VPSGLYESLGLDREKVADQFDQLVDNKDVVMAMAGMMNPQ
jgi:hypothetical protein